MSKQRGKSNKPFKSRPNLGDKAREVLENIDETCPVIQQFRQYSIELDDKNDRYERIVKLSRDITIESKRIIFLLHSVQTDLSSKRDSVFEEAKNRLDVLINTNFKSIGKELLNKDGYLYHRAYTAGLQEFIEAYSYYQYLKNEQLETYDVINDNFLYTEDDSPQFRLLFNMSDYILGIADFTGELMRRCINTLSSGNVDDCFKLCNYVKYINSGFLGLIVPGNREFSHKGYTLRQSLLKMELVCYHIKIRGSEVPKHMLVNVFDSNEANNEDEGFY